MISHMDSLDKSHNNSPDKLCYVPSSESVWVKTGRVYCKTRNILIVEKLMPKATKYDAMKSSCSTIWCGGCI